MYYQHNNKDYKVRKNKHHILLKNVSFFFFWDTMLMTAFWIIKVRGHWHCHDELSEDDVSSLKWAERQRQHPCLQRISFLFMSDITVPFWTWGKLTFTCLGEHLDTYNFATALKSWTNRESVSTRSKQHDARQVQHPAATPLSRQVPL